MTIDLTRHAVVEASAGTGKTHTIQELVLRLLVEARVSIQEILVLTYTEKAAGELRDRIRGALETQLKEQPEHGVIWRRALDQFDQAPISTIHAFCQRLLGEYALEQGQDFHGQLVDDGSLLESLLRDIQRKEWRDHFRGRLRSILESAQYDRDKADNWDRRVCEIARHFRPQRGHRLLPELPSKSDPAVIDNTFRSKIQQLRALASRSGSGVSEHPWITGFGNCKMNWKACEKRSNKLLQPLVEWLNESHVLERATCSYLRLENDIYASFPDEFPDQGFAAVFLRDEYRETIGELCPGLPEAVAILEELRRLSGELALGDELLVRTIHWLHECLAKYKAERALYSYEDQIVHAERALDPAKSPGAAAFARTLRERFRFAVIDEFQDTDPLQWRIFERLFLEGKETRLFVVGDPKQAIFGFRDADLPTYLDAVHQMRTKHAASSYPLKVNWRSTPEMLRALNHLFGKGDWFPGAGPYSYQDVEAAPEKERLNTIESDRTDRPALALVDWRETKKLTECRSRHARFIAEEIRCLLDGRHEIVHKKERTLLEARHIAVLVFRRTEAAPLVQALRENDIPYTFYKQPGLWESEEAKHLLYVLKAIAAPEDRAQWRQALLTCFFQLKPGDLAMCEQIPAGHPARVRMRTWIGHAEKRNWSALAHSLLEDTGLLFRRTAGVNLDRRLSNLRYLLGRLQELGYRENPDLVDLIAVFQDREMWGGDDEDDVQPIETDEPKVRILTIHASKGLEFPVVFLAGGFTCRKVRPTYVRYRENGREVFNLRPDEAANELANGEQEANERRLLYVALTRAMLKLYVPLLRPGQGNQADRGPVVTILAEAVAKSDLAALGEPVAARVDGNAPPPPSTAPRNLSTSTAAKRDRLVLPDPIFPAVPRDLGRRRLLMHSFSSLHRALSRRRRDEDEYGEARERAADEEVDAPDSLRGPVLGEMVHEILEAIDFAAVARADSAEDLPSAPAAWKMIEGTIARHLPRFRSREPRDNLEKQCRTEVTALVWNALRTPLPGMMGRLCDIPPVDRRAELEFHFPLPGDEPLPEELQRQEGYVTGFIDLVFRNGGRYFLLDWKTNLLESYDAGGIEDAMRGHEYHRQYGLYLVALRRWLAARHGAGFDFDRLFGGVYYLFLRGLNGTENSPGIFRTLGARPLAAVLS